MEQYRQITFKQAMEIIADDRLDILYFESRGGITCIEGWNLEIFKLKDEKWYVKEQIK